MLFLPPRHVTVVAQGLDAFCCLLASRCRAVDPPIAFAVAVWVLALPHVAEDWGWNRSNPR